MLFCNYSIAGFPQFEYSPVPRKSPLAAKRPLCRAFRMLMRSTCQIILVFSLAQFASALPTFPFNHSDQSLVSQCSAYSYVRAAFCCSVVALVWHSPAGNVQTKTPQRRAGERAYVESLRIVIRSAQEYCCHEGTPCDCARGELVRHA